MFRDPATVQAVNATNGDLQANTQFKQVSVTDKAGATIMDQWTGLMALATKRQVAGARFKSESNLCGTAAMDINVITWPERGKINMMHSDSRVKEPVGLATTSVPDPCLSTYLSPRLREEPFLWGYSVAAACSFSLLSQSVATASASAIPWAAVATFWGGRGKGLNHHTHM